MTYESIWKVFISSNRFFDVLNRTFFLGGGQELEGDQAVEKKEN